MWFDGLPRMVFLLQEFEKDGDADDSLCCQATLSGGGFCRSFRVTMLVQYLQLMAMNVVPRLVLDDA